MLIRASSTDSHLNKPAPRPTSRSWRQNARHESREGRPIPEATQRIYGLPPEESPHNHLPSSASTQKTEIHIAKSVEEAREILRRAQAKQAQRGLPQNAMRYEARVINVEQAREMLRQLREQQAQGASDDWRGAAISELESAIEKAAGSSQKLP